MPPPRGPAPRAAFEEADRAARTPGMTKCPECESDLELDGYDLDVGENVNCPECSIELKVVATEPTRVALADAES